MDQPSTTGFPLDLARAPLLAATREDPGRARAWLDLSTIYQYQGDFAEGRRATQTPSTRMPG